MMMNIDSEVDRQRFAQAQPTPEPSPEPAPIAEVKPEKETHWLEDKSEVRNSRGSYRSKPEEEWGPDELLDYVRGEIESRFGPIPSDSMKEKTIFVSFCKRWGDKAVPITKAAFEVFDGWWNNTPIGITRWCQGSDPYFAQVIVERLPDKALVSW